MSALPLTPRRRSLLRPLLLALGLLAGSTLAWANSGGGEAKKDAEPPPKEPTYIKEQGVDARGYNYKRVAREEKGEPEPVPKAPPAPAPVKEDKGAEKKAEGHGGGHGEEPKKDEKKKEEKKEDKKEAKSEGHGGGGEHGGGGGGHGEKEAKVEKKIQLSKIYARSLIRLGADNRPLTPVMHSNRHADYFLCRDTLADRYRDTLIDEMNTFSDQMGLARVQALPCMVKIAKPGTKVPGAVFVEFYVNEAAARTCIRGGECGETRLVLLMPKDLKGKSPQEIYRSYTLTDATKYKRADYCVSPRGQLLASKNCYVHLHPDWLFN